MTMVSEIEDVCYPQRDEMFFCRRYDHEWTVSNFIGAGAGVVILSSCQVRCAMVTFRFEGGSKSYGEETCIKRKRSID